MAPFHFTGVVFVLVTLLIGFCFGFVLEQAGFGNCRNLAAQFYLHDMRVLKVMFTAIVTAMVLLFACVALGWVDFTSIWVPPTRLGPEVVGGLLLGFGFIVGGYCPGTSLVSAATLKADGAFFAGGVASGMFLFGVGVPRFWQFFNFSGDRGRWTLYQWLHVDAGLLVVAVVLMAVGAFAFAEWCERTFAGRREPDLHGVSTVPNRPWRYVVALCGLGVAGLTVLIGQPTTAREVRRQLPVLQQKLSSRQVFIDPGELADLMRNDLVERVLLDVRPEDDYNEFHLKDARRTTLAELDKGWAKGIEPEAVVVIMSNDERAATEAWKRVAVYPNANAYILAGGINRWLALYHDQRVNVPGPDHPAEGNDLLRHRLKGALASNWPEARPDPTRYPKRVYEAHIKLRKPVHAQSGGCG